MSSFALDNSSDCSGSRRRIQGSRFMHGDRISCVSMFDSPPDLLPGERNQEQTHGVSLDVCKPSQSSSSSSIGKNSDISERLSSDGVDSGDTTTEVQSTYKGGPLDAMDALEEVLPIRRGISRFYNGKSKSFASLAYASSSSSSVKDIAKPENAYTKKRRNLLATSLARDKSRTSSPLLRSNGNGAAGISKRLTNLSRTSKLALAVAMRRSTTSSAVESNSTNDDVDDDDLNLNMNNNLVSRSSSSSLRRSSFQAHHHVISLSPHLARDFSAWRSFSLADLHCASHDVATTQTSGSSSSSDEARSPS